MIIEQTFKISVEELTTISDSAKVLNDIVWNLRDDEAIKIYDTYYDKEFVTSVFAFLCDMLEHNNLTIVKNK